MGGNPKDSPWRSTPRAARKRKGVELMLSDEARIRLDQMAFERGVSRSALVEEMILSEEEEK